MKKIKRPAWILVLTLMFFWVMIIGLLSFGLYIKSSAKKNNLALPGQLANTLRSSFGIEFVEYLEKKLHNFNDFRRRLVYNIIGEKIQTRQIAASELAATIQTDISGGPLNITPYLAGNTLPGEGVWIHSNMPKDGNRPIVYKTFLRTDPKRPYSIVDVAAVDISKVKFHLVAGSHYHGLGGQTGTGLINYLHRPKLVASMNGGFLPVHKTGGMIIDGKVFLPMISGKATFAVYKDNSVKIVVWKKSMMADIENIEHARQNLNILVTKGKFNNKAGYWGIVKRGEDPVYNWRSAIGLTRDGKWLIFAAGRAMSPISLARVFQLAGCDTAMHMDMNISNIAFNYYVHRDDDVQAVSISEKFWQHMAGAYLRGYTHDFIYMTKRD
jgi:hypothetical protein